MINVCFVPAGGEFHASSRVRCLSLLSYFAPLLKDMGVEAHSGVPSVVDDVVVVYKKADRSRRAFAQRVIENGGRIVFDISDNHFWHSPMAGESPDRGDSIKMCKMATRIVCCTEFLANVVRSLDGVDPDKVLVVEDPIDYGVIRQRSSDPALTMSGDKKRILWFGNSGNKVYKNGLHDLAHIFPDLVQLGLGYELHIICNDFSGFHGAFESDRMHVIFHKWDINTFAAIARQCHIAVMPVRLNPYTLSKSHNRVTSSLLLGLDVVASDVPSYREFGVVKLADSSWANEIAFPKTADMSTMHKYQPEAVAKKYVDVIGELI